MFLPVLLIRDFGVWGWVVFAVPNVVGAAAMGWTIRSQQQSRSMVEAHRVMAEAFSVITTAFQVFFSLWLLSIWGPRWAISGWVVIAAGIPAMLATMRWPTFGRWAAISVLAFSVAAIARAYQSGQLENLRGLQSALELDAHRNHYSVAALAIVCTVGFALCPYLDLTFHRARQNLSTQTARTSFSLGFGVFFFAMIVFTLAYWMIVDGAYVRSYWPNSMGARAVAAYMVVQLTLTCALHWSELEALSQLHGRWAVRWVLGSILLGFLARLCVSLMPVTKVEPGEVVYRLFMGFYGLVFPAYVWICVMPHWQMPAPPSRRMWVVLAGAVVAAAPFYWAGFIANRMIWVVPGVVIVLLSRAAIQTDRTAPKIG